MFGGKKHRSPSRTRWLIYGLLIGFLVGIILGSPSTGFTQLLTDPLSLVDAITGITL